MYNYKYLKYKSKYDKLQTGGNCSIGNKDQIVFGNGGSTAIIVITPETKVYKMFTIFDLVLDTESEHNIQDSNKKAITEINIYKSITKNIINKKVSPHFVKYIKSHECDNAKQLFDSCPDSYVKFLKLTNEQKTNICKKYYMNYPNINVIDTYNVIEIEYCDYSCADYIQDISHLPEIDMEKYLDILFFQLIHTIISTQDIYKYFTHNDLFMRNILGKREKDNGNYYVYVYNDKKYYVPQKKFFPKINDFGFTNLNDKYKNTKLYESKYKDIYNIMYDIYDGNGLGSQSLIKLCKDNATKLLFVKKYFSNFFNVNMIDYYVSQASENMDWDWSNIVDDEFMKSIEMRDPIDLLNNYFYNIFSKINSEINLFNNTKDLPDRYDINNN